MWHFYMSQKMSNFRTYNHSKAMGSHSRGSHSYTKYLRTVNLIFKFHFSYSHSFEIKYGESD